jgi:acetyl esterase/lipase
MPVGYLITALIVLWCTWSALAPPRNDASGMLSFLSSSLLNELPGLALCYLAASTALAAEGGGLASTGGILALGLVALAAAGLVVVAWRGLRTDEVVEQALERTFGRGGRPVPASRRRIPLRGLWAPFPLRGRDVERVADIPYGPEGRRHLLDVYRSRSRRLDGAPVLVHLHGGGFTGGRKNRQSLALLHRFARRGWLCVSANYRLSPFVRFPDHLVDVKRVVGWVREHAHEWGADPSVLILAGTSSGAHLAAMAAFSADAPALQPGFPEADTSVTAAVALSGYYGRVPAAPGTPSSPLDLLEDGGADAPPFFVAHGTHDTVVPVQTCRLFVRRLREVSSSPVVYAELPGAQHAFDRFASLRFARVVDGVEEFADRVVASRTPKREA